jgi:hypothetical protein
MVAASVLETIVDDKVDVVVHELISSLESSHPTVRFRVSFGVR